MVAVLAATLQNGFNVPVKGHFVGFGTLSGSNCRKQQYSGGDTLDEMGELPCPQGKVSSVREQIICGTHAVPPLF